MLKEDVHQEYPSTERLQSSEDLLTQTGVVCPGHYYFPS